MTDDSKQHAGLGFTLVELLVVLAVIALLAVLMVPTFSGVYHVAHTTTCGNNLRRIGEGVRSFYSSDPGGREVMLSPIVWQAQLSKYLGGGEVFICPEDQSESQVQRNLPLAEQVGFHSYSGSSDYIAYFDDSSPWVAKLSDQQWQAAGIRDLKLYNVPPYDPGSDPSVYWYIFEDWHDPNRSDYDYDISVRVTENGDGTATLMLKQHGTGYNHDLIDLTDNNKVIMRKSQMTGTGSAEHKVVIGGSGVTSYGMNGEIARVSNDVEKIMALDYPWTVARSTHDWSMDKFASDIPGIPIFARHHGKINVLFTGGSVRLKRPDEVNPIHPGIQRTLWDE